MALGRDVLTALADAPAVKQHAAELRRQIQVPTHDYWQL